MLRHSAVARGAGSLGTVGPASEKSEGLLGAAAGLCGGPEPDAITLETFGRDIPEA